MNSFGVVDEFEKRVAEYAGARYGIATSTGTAALFLALKYRLQFTTAAHPLVYLPAHTFVSVPMAIVQAGGRPVFKDETWQGTYELVPWDIVDGALRFRRGMYQKGYHCLSFHARKILNIGEGGMILTDDATAMDWLRAARYSGRKAPHYRIEDVDMIGYQLYMTPEKAARGLHLMDYVKDDNPDQVIEYPDLRKVKVFCDGR